MPFYYDGEESGRCDYAHYYENDHYLDHGRLMYGIPKVDDDVTFPKRGKVIKVTYLQDFSPVNSFYRIDIMPI